MARFRLTVNEKRSMGAAIAQQQEQELQQQQQQEVRTQRTDNNNTSLIRPTVPPVLALPAFQRRNRRSGNGVTRYATSEDNIEELEEERSRLIQRYAGGELQFLIDWFEHIHRDLEEIRRELDSVEEELSRKPSA